MAARTRGFAIAASLGLAVATASTGCNAAGEPTRPMTRDLPSTVEAALDDAAGRSGLARTALRVVSAEEVTWADGSLGCPQPGASYTMALVPGYRIRIQAGAQLLDYHAGTRGALQLCPSGQAIDPAPLQTK